MKTLATSLILREKIKTTEAKAKELSSFLGRKMTKAKTNDVVSRRLLAKYFSGKVVKKMVDELGQRYKDRKGGYTRIIKLGPRKSDSSKMVYIELVK